MLYFSKFNFNLVLSQNKKMKNSFLRNVNTSIFIIFTRFVTLNIDV